MPDITISVTAQQATRIAAALGRYHNLTDENGAPRAATAQEVTNHLKQNLKALVLQQERGAAEAAVVVTSFE